MTNSAWPGIIIMAAMVVGLVWWIVWAIRKDKAANKDEK
jgi:hypothetical protein